MILFHVPVTDTKKLMQDADYLEVNTEAVDRGDDDYYYGDICDLGGRFPFPLTIPNLWWVSKGKSPLWHYP